MELNEIYKTVRSMHSGELYLCDDENLVKEQTKQLDLLFDYNALRPSQQKEKAKLLKKCSAPSEKAAISKHHFTPTGAESSFISVTVFTQTLTLRSWMTLRSTLETTLC